jgi:transcription termination factor Rho
MTVLDRAELEASPLADLHLIADQLGMESYRRLRKAELIDAIVAEQGGESRPEEESASAEDRSARRPRLRRRRRAPTGEAEPEHAGVQDAEQEEQEQEGEPRKRPARRRRSSARERASAEETTPGGEAARTGADARTAEGVVEVLANGSAFLRLHADEHSDEDVYVSAAQVRRCELVSGDRVSGPVRAARRSERYPSLVRIETINGQPADALSEGKRYDELPARWPSERLAFGSDDPTLKAIEWLTPLGRGSRALIVGPSRAGKTEALRRISLALADQQDLQTTLVLAGARPEEIAEWSEGPLQPAAALSFAASADAQGHAVEGAVETGKRLAARGEHAVVLIDGLDGLHPHSARKVMASARCIPDGGSLTVIATAARPFGGETTVIALDVAHAGAGRFPALDLLASGTLRAELLVGEQGAAEIARARADAAEG